MKSTHHSPAVFLGRDLLSALNFFRDPPTDGLTLSVEENKLACFGSPACTRAATLLQFLLSILLFVGTVYFTQESLQELATEPMVRSKSASFPAPDLVKSLFERFAKGEISSLSCPCSQSQHSLGNITSKLDFQMDSFAKEYITPGFDTSPDGINRINTYFDKAFKDLESPLQCVKDLTKLKNDLWGFLGSVDKDSNDTFFNTSDVPFYYDFLGNPRISDLEYQMATAVCEFAFGMSLNNDASQWKPSVSSMTACNGNVTLLPQRLAGAFLKGRELFPFLQAGRNAAYQSRMTGTINTLTLYGKQLNTTSRDRTIVTQNAVSPTELQAMARAAFDDERSTYGPLVAGLVPGMFVDQELFETSYGPSIAVPFLSPPAALYETTSLYSCPLPFGRTDFGPSTFLGAQRAGDGSGFFYVIPTISNTFLSPSTILGTVQAAGRAGLRINATSSTNFFATYPFSPFMAPRDYPTLSYLADNDFLTVLDACARGDSLSVEIYSLFPVNAGWSTFIRPEKCCSKFGGTPGGTTFSSPSTTPLFTVPVSCPARLVNLGRQRAASSLGGRAFDSRLRASLASTLSELKESEVALLPTLYDMVNIKGFLPNNLTPPLKTLFDNLWVLYNTTMKTSGDLQDRANILSTLLINLTSINITADPLLYYQGCAPKQCAWIELTYRTVFQTFREALEKLGGTYGAVMGVLFAVYILCFLVARACLRGGAGVVAAEVAGNGGGGKGAGGGGDDLDPFLDGAKTGGALLLLQLNELREVVAAQGRELARLRPSGIPYAQLQMPAITVRQPEAAVIPRLQPPASTVSLRLPEPAVASGRISSQLSPGRNIYPGP